MPMASVTKRTPAVNPGLVEVHFEMVLNSLLRDRHRASDSGGVVPEYEEPGDATFARANVFDRSVWNLRARVCGGSAESRAGRLWVSAVCLCSGAR